MTFFEMLGQCSLETCFACKFWSSVHTIYYCSNTVMPLKKLLDGREQTVSWLWRSGFASEGLYGISEACTCVFQALRMETAIYGSGSMHVHLATTRFNIAQILLEKGDQVRNSCMMSMSLADDSQCSKYCMCCDQILVLYFPRLPGCC